MKKLFFTLSAFVSFMHYSNAQNGNANANTQWKINGNNASTTDFMGTTNAQSLIFKTNNIARLQLDVQGKLILNSGKEMIINPIGLIRPEKTNPIAAYMLKIGGSAHIDDELNTRQLFVQEYITYMKSLKGPSMNVDTIRMDSTRGIFGHTKIFGDVLIKQNLEVLGDVKFKGNAIAENGFTFNGFNGLHYTPATATNGEVFQLGNKIAKVTTVFCSTPSTYHPLNTFQYEGGFISRVATGTGIGSTNASLTFAVAPWNGNGMIELSGVSSGNLENNALSINEFCKRNTYINIGWDGSVTPEVNGGRVVMGAEVEMMRSLKIGWNGTPSVIDPKTAIEINQNTDNANGVKVQTWNNSIKAYSVLKSDGRTAFLVHGDGTTEINTLANDAFIIRDPLNSDPLTNINFKVKNTGKTQIGTQIVNSRPNSLLTVSGEIDCKSLYVLKPTNWQDRVFMPDYKLQNLKEVEAYIKINKHLPGIKSEKEILENGYDVNETDAVLLEKIENLYLYIIQQQKEIEELKTKINKR